MSLPVEHTSPPANLPDLPLSEPVVRTDRRVLLNTGALAGSSLWRIGLSFILQLFIANRLGAVGLGQYATALAYLNVCQVLSELGLPQLLVRDLARSPHQRRLYFRAALGLQLSAAFLTWMGLAALAFLLPFEPVTRTALLIITASLPFFAISSICTTLFQAGERMELVMVVEMIVNAIIIFSSVIILWQGGTVIHLAAVMIASQTFSAVMYWGLLSRTGLLGKEDQSEQTWPEVVRLLWHKARPFYGLSLANVLLHRLDILLLSIVAGEVVTGIYSAAYLMVRVLLILSQTYWQALYPTLSRLRQQTEQQSWRLASLGIRYGLMALLPIAAICSGVAEPLLGIIFPGERYAESVPVFQVLVWAPPLFLLATFAVNLLLVERHPQFSLRIALVHLLVILLLLPPLSAQLGALGASYAVLAAIGCSAITGLLLIRRLRIPIDFSFRWPRLGLATLLVVVVLHLLSTFSPALFWPLSVLIASALYLTILWYGSLLSVQDLLLFQRALRR
jgi:O-antigen/teichoic acid export membrane protein